MVAGLEAGEFCSFVFCHSYSISSVEQDYQNSLSRVIFAISRRACYSNRMKQLIITALVMCGLALVPVHQVGAAEQYTNDADIKVIDDATKALVAFDDETVSDTASYETVKPRLQAAVDKLDILQGHTFSTDPGAGYTSAAMTIKDKARALKSVLQDLMKALDAGDKAATTGMNDAYLAAAKALDDAINQLNIAVDSKNAVDKQTDEMTGSAYIASLVVTALLSAASFAWAFTKKDVRAEVFEAQKAIAFNSLWPLGGSVITYASYAAATNGGKYTVLWGAVVFGLYMFVQSIRNYLKLRKVLPVAKTQ